MGCAVTWETLLSAALFVAAAAGQAHQQPPNQLVRQVISHELQAEEHDNSYWIFRLQQTQSGVTKIVAKR